MFELDSDKQGPRIRVVGIGGCGGNAVNSIAKRGIHGVDLIAVNTDLQDLERNVSPNKIQIGKTTTRGLGAGSNPEIGRRAAMEARDPGCNVRSRTATWFSLRQEWAAEPGPVRRR